MAGVFRVSVTRVILPGWNIGHVTLGRSPSQADLLRTTGNYCQGRVSAGSIYGVLHRECFALVLRMRCSLTCSPMWVGAM